MEDNDMAKERTQFCIECRKETGYEIRKGQCTHCIKGQEYTFEVLTAVCDECGEEVNFPLYPSFNGTPISSAISYFACSGSAVPATFAFN